ncbi:MAG: leucine-rich repeat domain-containing protein [Clostridia bacterium]|nr:leucine-rich repeat domain-containing protein [Clostridia bacterium]
MKLSKEQERKTVVKAFLTLASAVIAACFILFVYGCEPEEEQAANTTITVERVEALTLSENEVLTWSPVSGADGYEITVNGKTLYSSQPQIDLFFEFDDDIDYKVSVRAYSYGDSGERVFGEASRTINYSVPVLTSGFTYTAATGKVGYQIQLIDPSAIRGKFVIPSKINGVSVTQITASGFAEATGLTGIIFGDSVTQIGARAFENCSGLKMCRLPDNLTKLNNRVFYGCPSIELLIVPEKLTTIDTTAFLECDLKKIKVDENNTKYYVEGNCLIDKNTKTVILGAYDSVIPLGVTAIGSGAFRGRTLETIGIPEGVVEIGVYAFGSCKNLKEITLPSSLTTLGSSCFNGCSALEEITVPSKVKALPAGCFEYCSSLKRVTIEDGVERIGVIEENPDLPQTAANIYGVSVFSGCNLLTEINVPSSVTKIGAKAFNNLWNLERIDVAKENPCFRSENGYLIETATDTIVSGVKNAAIPLSVKKIGPFSFYGLKPVGVEVPSNVVSIGDYAFNGCNSLEYVVLPDTLEYIGDNAFGDCYCAITLPSINAEIGVLCFDKDTLYTAMSSIDMKVGSAIDLCECALEKDGDGYYVKSIRVSCEKRFSDDDYYKTKPFYLFEERFVAPYRSGYEFLGWSYTESENDIVFHVERKQLIDTEETWVGTIEYRPGERYLIIDMYKMKEILGEVTLYAIWRKL